MRFINGTVSRIKEGGPRCVGLTPARKLEEAEYMEYCVQTTDLNQRLVAERFPLVDGHVAIPERPGLGIELDEAVLQQLAVRWAPFRRDLIVSPLQSTLAGPG
jgi:Enolase C-terminal domain-like